MCNSLKTKKFCKNKTMKTLKFNCFPPKKILKPPPPPQRLLFVKGTYIIILTIHDTCWIDDSNNSSILFQDFKCVVD